MTGARQPTARWHWLALALVCTAAFALRLYKLGDIPAGLFCDEAANGYNAWSLLHYGQDEHGKTFPLFIWSFFAFKYPLYIYPSMLWTGLLGLTELSTRMQAAVYGTATVAVAFLIGRQLFRPTAGLAAAVFLAVLPWHVHFSRIAFSLIGFPFWFGLGFYFLARALGAAGRRRDWLLAAFFLGACVYSYAISQAIVPLLLLAVVLLFPDVLWRRRGDVLLAALVGLLTIGPFLVFQYRYLRQATIYTNQISVFGSDKPLRERLEIVFEQHLPQYFNRQFLFEQGDPILRHGVRNQGVLYAAMLPWMVIGALAALLRRGRVAKLLFVWLLLYPLGASMAWETPSASRSILGTLIFALLAGIGIDSAAAVLQRLPRLWLRVPPILALLGFAAWQMAPQVQAYLHRYFVEYPTYAAVGIEGFQYGYRDLFRLIKQWRRPKDRVLQSTTVVNSPYIFGLFYGDGSPPVRRSEWGDAELDIGWTRPAQIDQWYRPGEPLLLAALPLDLFIFESWDERADIRGPANQLAFTLFRNPVPKRFIDAWELIGPIDNPDNRLRYQPIVDPGTMRPLQPVLGPNQGWQRFPARNGMVDMNDTLAQRLTPRHGNIEFAAAALRTVLVSPDEREAQLEVYGSGDELIAWLNSVPTGVGNLMLNEVRPTFFPLHLRAGRNELVLQTNETVGDWWFMARVTTPAGVADPDVRAQQYDTPAVTAR